MIEKKQYSVGFFGILTDTIEVYAFSDEEAEKIATEQFQNSAFTGHDVDIENDVTVEEI